MNTRGTPNIKTRSITVRVAIVFSFLSITALVILSGIQLYISFLAERDEVFSRQQLIAEDAAKTVAGFVQDKFKKLKAAERFGNLATAKSFDQNVVLDKLLGEESSFRQLTLLDMGGREISRVSQRSAFSSSQSAELDKKTILSELANKPTYTSQVFVDTETNEPEVFLGVPVTDVFGDTRGVLVAELNLKFMWNVVGGIPVGDDGHAYVVDREGNLVAFSDTSRVLKGENLTDITVVKNFINKTKPTKDLLGFSRGILGTYVLDTHVSLENPDWAVVVELPIGEAYARVLRTIIISLFLIAIFIGLLILFSVYLSRMVTRPINALSRVASSIATGNFTLRAPVESGDEIGELAKSFNAMIDAVVSEGALRKQIIKILPDALFLTDMDGNIKQINPTVTELLQYTTKDLLNKPIKNIFSETSKMGLEKLFEKGGTNDKLVSLVAKDKTIIPVTLNGRVMKGAKKEDDMILLVALDRRSAEALEKSKNEFVAIASHQLRTPLTGIKWSLKTLIENDAGALNPEQADLVTGAFGEVTRMAILINDLLSATRIEEGKSTILVKPCSLGDVVKKTFDRVDIYAKRKGVNMKLSIEPDIPDIPLDEERMTLVLENLFDNSIKYTPKDGDISVAVKRVDGKVVLEVTDTGIGIPERQSGQVFEKFFRADNAMLVQTSGSGLGLYVAKNIVEGHHGTITISSKEKIGTTITVTLPMSPEHVLETNTTKGALETPPHEIKQKPHRLFSR